MVVQETMQGQEDSLTTLSMNILIHAGNARVSMIKGLDKIEAYTFEEADKLFKQSRSEIVAAHGLQTDTLQLEAKGEQIRYSPLFSHAQDTLMTAQSELLIANHLNQILKKYSQGDER